MAVRPKVDRANGIVLTLNIVARDVDDVNEFMENLEETGAFRNLLSDKERFNEEGLLESILETNYMPASAKPEPEAPARGARPRP